MKYTVWGHTGVVGSQLYRWLSEHGQDVAGVSLDRTDGKPGEHDDDWHFLCLPTPNNELGQQDPSALVAVLPRLSGHVVVRSTVLPGTCRRIQQGYAHFDVHHWPEFLSERTAWEDFCHPKVRIVGTEAGDSSIWHREIQPLLPEAPTVYLNLEQAEVVKYAHNVHGAMQIVFANVLYDACQKAGADWGAFLSVMPMLGYISPATARAYWDVWKDGQRGYGGNCFPKDVDALRAWMDSPLLDGIAEENRRLRGLG